MTVKFELLFGLPLTQRIGRSTHTAIHHVQDLFWTPFRKDGTCMAETGMPVLRECRIMNLRHFF